MHHFRICIKSILAPTLVFLGCTQSAQTGVKKSTFSEAIRASDAIIIATCVGKESFWNANHSLIFTRATFRINQIIIGQLADTKLDIRYLGGQVGDVVQDASFKPGFKVSKNYLLLLSPPKNTSLLITKEEDGSGEWTWPRVLVRSHDAAFEVSSDRRTGRLFLPNPPMELVPVVKKGYSRTLHEKKMEKAAERPIKERAYLDHAIDYIKANRN